MERIRAWLLALAVVVVCGVAQVRSSASDHRYTAGDEVPLYANKVAPVKEKKEALGEVLNGDRLVSAPYRLDFLLTKEEVAKFRTAVSKNYYFQMYYNDLPIWGFLGKVDKEGKADPSEYKYYLFKHLIFEILYNKDRVIEITVRSDPNSLVDLTQDEPVNVDFMYTVKWKETETPFEKRMDKYSQSSSMPHHLEIHWYAHDEESADDQEETGWKYIHGDVFRYPKHKSLFSAALGSGTQLFTLTSFIFILALVGVFYPYNRGALFTALVVIYALTSLIAGYTAASFYCQLEGTNWATAALPFGTIVVIFLIWALVTSPLLILGGIAGKNTKAEFQAPCRTTIYPRVIPPLPWYQQTLPQMAMAGFLPFSAICIELYYIFASVWGHRIYTIDSILFIVFILLLIVSAFVTVAMTYFQLAAEDHEWWWRYAVFSFLICIYKETVKHMHLQVGTNIVQEHIDDWLNGKYFKNSHINIIIWCSKNRPIGSASSKVFPKLTGLEFAQSIDVYIAHTSQTRALLTLICNAMSFLCGGSKPSYKT
ncbi:hypothetical protein ES332_D07G205600v1 [Gossypium tomentosum]|uniref:Transmembrane 9 superfamily member n=1 Tax=Gossypium tomentosum TaxID=34277 RepID=A0A5D2K9H2_GOSTO|nr:hypothetical protein ES332_D07G205600v1 [Gossypium tomentosum]